MKRIKLLHFLALAFICISMQAGAQQRTTLSGTVTNDQQEKMPGVTVKLKNTNTGTVTDEQGRYSLPVTASEGTLVFSFLNYATQEVAIGGRSRIDIVLKNEESKLDEVVVVGYGTLQRKDVTGAISSVTAKDLENQPAMTLEQLMQGKASGVQITQTTGAPGGQIEVRIRGASSINAGNEPLYVIDGVPYYNGSQDPDGTSYGTTTPTNALASLNPNDIASVDILKDASATAIYGSRGSNGVVIITTKRGKAGGMRVNYNGYFGVQQVVRKVDVMNASQHAAFLNAWAAANNNPIPFPHPDSLGKGTDWQDEIFRPAVMQNHQVSMSGSMGKSRYYISGNFYDQEGIVINTGMKRYTFRANFDQDISDRLTVSETFAYSKTDSKSVPINGAGKGNVRSAGERALLTSPILSVYDSKGEFNTVPWYGATKFENPVASLQTTYGNLQRDNVTGNITLSYKLLDGLVAKSLVGVNMTNTDNKEYYPRSTTYIGGVLGGLGFLANRRVSNVLNENTLTYSKVISKHKFDVLGGMTTQSEKDFSATNQPTLFPDDRLGINNIDGATGVPMVSSLKTQWSLVSFIGRVNYQYAGKYLLTASIRADGSSKFADGHKWGYFPSVAAGYRLSEEKFIKQLGLFDDLKLRVSYGVTGNQEVGSYQSLPRLVTDASYIVGGQLLSGARLTSLANRDLTWEESKQLDVGLNASFLHSRINVGFDYYKKRTENLLFSIDIPATSGYGSSKALFNTGSLYNRGFEVDLSAALLTHDFKWDLSANFSRNKSVLTSLGESPGTTTLFVGYAPGTKLGQVYLGVFHDQKEIDAYGLQPDAKPGDMKFADTNGDGKFTGDDRLPIGTPMPKYIFGVTNTFSYKGFDLTVFVESSVGRKGDDIDLLNDPTDLTSNKYKKFVNIWTPENAETATVPGPGVSNYSYSTFDIVDRSYFKLRNIRLSYTFPHSLIPFLGSTAVYLSGENLITISDYPGFDPETGSVGYPTTKTVVLGLNIGF
ncbi:TonB-dependent receptor [Compostibacter hankyongensis]|uniref:TonB-dependent receptor n=1 Tax=Compostibacter hankyongensis TaxID=1007089 RepID=A0ABP8G5G6_9BACT